MIVVFGGWRGLNGVLLAVGFGGVDEGGEVLGHWGFFNGKRMSYVFSSSDCDWRVEVFLYLDRRAQEPQEFSR